MKKVNKYIAEQYKKIKNDPKLKHIYDNTSLVVYMSSLIRNLYDEKGGKIVLAKQNSYTCKFDYDSSFKIFTDLFGQYLDTDVAYYVLMEHFCYTKTIDMDILLLTIKNYVLAMCSGEEKHRRNVIIDTFEMYALMKLQNIGLCVADVNRYLCNKLTKLKSTADQTIAHATLLDIYKNYGVIDAESISKYQKEFGGDVYGTNYSEIDYERCAEEMLTFPIAFDLATRMCKISGIRDMAIKSIVDTNLIYTGENYDANFALNVTHSYGDMIDSTFSKARVVG